MTSVAETPPLYPTPQTPSSLPWYRLRIHLKCDPKVDWALLYRLFLLYPGCALMVGPYANSFNFSYSTEEQEEEEKDYTTNKQKHNKKAYISELFLLFLFLCWRLVT